MKKQETPAQPQAVPDAVADVSTRPFKIAASPFPYARKNSVFPRPLKTAAFRFPYARKNSGFTRPHDSAAFRFPYAQKNTFFAPTSARKRPVSLSLCSKRQLPAFAQNRRCAESPPK